MFDVCTGTKLRIQENSKPTCMQVAMTALFCRRPAEGNYVANCIAQIVKCEDIVKDVA